MCKHRIIPKRVGAYTRMVPALHHLKEVSCEIQPRIWQKKVASQIGMSPIMPFRFTQSSRFPSTCSLLLEHQWALSTTPNDLMHYCIHIRMTPTFPHMEWTTNHWYIARSLSSRSNHQSCGLSAEWFSEGVHSRRGFSLTMHRTLSLAWWVQLIGLGELHR